jgi:hypothetical protein
MGFDIPLFATLSMNVRRALLTITNIGWILMVTGFSMTLYSRVHLLLFNRRLLQALLAMIIINGCIVHIPAVITGYLPYSPRMLRAVTVISKMEIIFYIQEIFLSSLYAFMFVKFIGRDSISNSNSEATSATSKSTSNKARRTFVGLITAQLLVLACDITMIVLLYRDLYLARKLIMPFNYAIKVLLEYFVLNQLVRFSSTYTRGAEMQVGESESSGVEAVNGILGSRVRLN